jgi:adenylate cyclase
MRDALLFGPDLHTPAAPDLVAQVEPELRRAERQGLRIALFGRTAVLSVVALWLVYGTLFYGATTLTGLVIILGYLAAGLLLMRHVGRGGSLVLVYLFVLVEIVSLGVLAATVPLAASGGVPQIFVFRVYGAMYFLVLIASWALSLSPGLVLWAGAVSCATLWGVFLWIVARMPNTVSWSDFPPGGSAAEYVALVLSPDFIGRGNRIEETIVLAGVSALIALAVQRARELVRQRATADAKRLQTLEIFGQYMPPDVAERLVETMGGLTPRTQEGSVLFADIAGFTRFSETRTPEDVMRTMTEVFDLATEAVIGAGGLVVAFAGDAVVASFTVKGDAAAAADAAVNAARTIQQRMQERLFGSATLTMRIGIATGTIAAGSVGGSKRRAYTVYGDPVNQSQRLQELGKVIGSTLVICETTWRLAGSPDAFADLGLHELRGRAQGVRVLALRGGSHRGGPEQSEMGQ